MNWLVNGRPLRTLSLQEALAKERESEILPPSGAAITCGPLRVYLGLAATEYDRGEP